MSKLKQEPAVLIGLLVSILTIVGQVATAELTWAAAVPLIVGILTRFFVTPAPKPGL